MVMTESHFYALCDRMEQMKDFTEGYYPTVKELQDNHVEDNLEKYIELLVYFSLDPFTKQNIEGKDDKEYIEMVKYVKKILYKLELTEDKK